MKSAKRLAAPLQQQPRGLPRRFAIGYSLLIICALMFWPALATAQTAQPAQDDALVIPAGKTHTGSVATLNQPIVVEGVVEGDVTSVTGSIVVRGAIEGDVVSLFGNVIFEPQATADGNVMAATGSVVLPEGAMIAAGGTVYNGNLDGRGVASILPGTGNQPIDFAAQLVLSITLGILAVIVATLLSFIWPRSISGGARAISLAPGRAMALSVIWLVLTLIAVGVIATILIFSLVGLAILPVLLLAAQIPYLVGIAAAGQVVGERFGFHGPSAVAVGSSVLVVPCVGLAMISLPAAFGLFYALAGIGIGGMFMLRAAVVHRNSASY
ncbi:MAG: hypothetical protein H0T53_17310 [Herpetosiphonaceae bacterium]|nr:hypothetical protein [Herpetosiphonaceae bacterium]